MIMESPQDQPLIDGAGRRENSSSACCCWNDRQAAIIATVYAIVIMSYVNLTSLSFVYKTKNSIKDLM